MLRGLESINLSDQELQSTGNILLARGSQDVTNPRALCGTCAALHLCVFPEDAALSDCVLTPGFSEHIRVLPAC